MCRSGQSKPEQATARTALVPATPTVDLRALVSKLADPATAGPAAGTLKAQPPARLVPALVAGLGSLKWRVRRSCCQLLDDLNFTPESLAALQRALDDPVARVAVPRSTRSVASTATGCVLATSPRSQRADCGGSLCCPTETSHLTEANRRRGVAVPRLRWPTSVKT